MFDRYAEGPASAETSGAMNAIVDILPSKGVEDRLSIRHHQKLHHEAVRKTSTPYALANGIL